MAPQPEHYERAAVTPVIRELSAAALDRGPKLRVEPLVDPLVDELGYDARSGYVETFWLPVLGPSTVFLLRHLAARLESSPQGIEIDLEETARSLGLGERLSANAPFARTLKRCIDFEMAQWRRPGVFAVRVRLPPLARRHLRRLPGCLRTRDELAPVVSRLPISVSPGRLAALPD